MEDDNRHIGKVKEGEDLKGTAGKRVHTEGIRTPSRHCMKMKAEAVPRLPCMYSMHCC